MSQIDPVTAAIYQSIARIRRELRRDPDMPTEVVRQVLEYSLVAAEVLLQGLNQALGELEDRDRARRYARELEKP
jgi:hypothetical protein